MDYLDAKIVQFEETLHWLVDKHLIEVGESVFQITANLLPIPLSVPLVRPGQLNPLGLWVIHLVTGLRKEILMIHHESHYVENPLAAPAK
jgi:hypothetical protein